jgi:hypothetical protein
MPTRSDLTTNKADVGSLTIVAHDTGPHVSVSSQNKKITAARPPDPTTKRFGFVCYLRKSHEGTSNILNTGGTKRKRDKTNIEIGLGLLLKFQNKEE